MYTAAALGTESRTPGATAANEKAPPAPLAARTAAFLLDCIVGASIALAFGLLSWVLLLAVTGAGEHRAPDAAIYLALTIASAALPAWAVVTLLGWARAGQSPGLAAMSLRIVDDAGRAPSIRRALVRLLLIAAFAFLALFMVLLETGSIAAAAQGTLPAILIPPAVLIALAALIDPLSCFVLSEHRGLHDRLSGTRVLRAPAADQ